MKTFFTESVEIFSKVTNFYSKKILKQIFSRSVSKIQQRFFKKVFLFFFSLKLSGEHAANVLEATGHGRRRRMVGHCCRNGRSSRASPQHGEHVT